MVSMAAGTPSRIRVLTIPSPLHRRELHGEPFCSSCQIRQTRVSRSCDLTSKGRTHGEQRRSRSCHPGHAPPPNLLPGVTTCCTHRRRWRDSPSLPSSQTILRWQRGRTTVGQTVYLPRMMPSERHLVKAQFGRWASVSRLSPIANHPIGREVLAASRGIIVM